MKSNIPVLIVGAGPVGLTMAAELHRYGIACRIIDKKPEATKTSNACVIQARTLELLASMGIVEEILKKSLKITSVHMSAGWHSLAKLHTKVMDSPYPFLASLPQNETEAILINHLEKLGIIVERNVTFESFEQDDEIVTAKVFTTHGAETITANWLIGADGYKSTVREQTKIDYVGEDPLQKFIMIDAPIKSEHPLNTLLGFTSNEYTLLIVPFQDSCRLIAEVSQNPKYQNIEQIDEKIFMEICSKFLQKPITIGKARWNSKFFIHEKLAKAYRLKRIFLLGDAAHVHSPAGGQGMNMGMQDAINLAWKLALVEKQKSSPDLLDSYEAERRPVAQAVIKFTHTLIKGATSRNKAINILRNFLIPIISRFPPIQKMMVNGIAQLRFNYRKSPIVLAAENQYLLFAGDRAPNVTTHQNEMLFDILTRDKHFILSYRGNNAYLKKLEQKYAGLFQIISVSELDIAIIQRYNMNGPTYCIIRPDNYIGYIGKDIEDIEIEKYFQRLFK